MKKHLCPLIKFPLLFCSPRRLSVLFVALAFTFGASGQELRFRHFTNEDGLVGHLPFDFNMIQDKRGFLWVPTLNGVYRYDGRKFKAFQHDVDDPAGLNTNIVQALMEDRSGKIWIGTRGGGINIYDPKTGQFEYLMHDPDDEKSLPGNDIRAIDMDRDGNIWVGILRFTVCRYDSNRRKLNTYPNVGEIAFLQQQDGTIWKGGSRGLYKYLPEQDTFIHLIPYPELQSENYNGANALIEGPEGEIWLTSKRKGQKIFNPKTNTFRDFPDQLNYDPNWASANLYKDRYGHIWLGKDYGGMARYDPYSKKLKIYRHDPEDKFSPHPSKQVSTFQDRSGSMWFGHFKTEGLSVVHTIDHPFQVVFRNTEKWNPPMVNLNDRHLMIWAAENKVLYDFDNGELTPHTINIEGDPRSVYQLRLSQTQVLWWQNKFQYKSYGYNLETHKRWTFNGSQYFDLDSKGNVWPVTPKYYVPKIDTLISYQESLNQADTLGLNQGANHLSILVDQEDRIWRGSSKGILTKYDPELETFQFYKNEPGNPNSLVKGSIKTLFQGSNGWIYIWTENGLSIYQGEEGRFVNLNLTAGLPQYINFPMVEDSNGNIWIGMDKSLVMLNTENLNTLSFDENDGIPAGKFGYSAVRDKAGNLYFAKGGKVFRFHPDSIRQQRSIAPIVLSDFYLNHEITRPLVQDSPLEKNIEFLDEVVLNHTQTDFGFRFVSPTFYKSDQIEYFYRLENYDEVWISTGNELEAHFTNIPAGNYRFKVKAQTEAGVWTEGERAIRVKVLPPWWETTWAKALYLLAGMLGVFGFIRWRTAALNRRKKVLEKVVKKRTAEVVAQKDVILKEKERSEELLLNILPAETAKELKQYGHTKAKNYDLVTVLFLDIQGFTKHSENLSPEELVAEIDYCFKQFDQIVGLHQVEKIKTIGDAYMAAGGVPTPNASNPTDTVRAALDIRNFMLQYKKEREGQGRIPFEMRIGVHTGPVVAGVVGIKKFAYDIWGDTVNTAARMEASGEVGKVNISQGTFKLIQGAKEFSFMPRGKVKAKHKGDVEMYFVELA